jgi:alcohol dehydrogenase class IV
MGQVTELAGPAMGSGGAAAILCAFGVRRAVVVFAPSLADSEILANAVDGFGSSGVVLAEASPRPTKRDIDGVISLGGGSTIRAARELAGELPGAHHVAVPTTTSCVEQFGDSVAPRPDAIVLDSRGIRSVPRPQFVAQAFNAMTFAIEAVCGSDLSAPAVDSALQAVRGLRGGLLHAVNEDRLDDQTAMAMLMAAARAGAAAREAPVSIARLVGEALHDCATVPYALCVALVLPFALAFVRRACAHRIALLASAFEISQANDDVEAADAVIAAIRKLGQEAGLPRNFRSAGITRDAMEGAARTVPLQPAAKTFARPVMSSEQMMSEVFRFAW